MHITTTANTNNAFLFIGCLHCMNPVVVALYTLCHLLHTILSEVAFIDPKAMRQLSLSLLTEIIELANVRDTS